LGARPQHAPRIQAAATFRDGAALALYTDGLIERRREDIDTGLARLADSLARHQADAPEALADAVLTDLLPPGGATDDTALVIARLSPRPAASVRSIAPRRRQCSARSAKGGASPHPGQAWGRIRQRLPCCDVTRVDLAGQPSEGRGARR